MTAFLGVDYDDRMLRFNAADLSAIYTAPHHAYLRQGVIQRQKYDRELVPPATARKLDRFRCRWEQMQSPSREVTTAGAAGKPGPVEYAYHNAAGRLLMLHDSLVRAGFEFLPVAWLRVYRLLKNWLVNPPSGSPDEKLSMWSEFKKHDHYVK